MSRIREWLLYFLFRKEKDTMAVIYATLILKEKKFFSQVPPAIKEQVRNILIDMDLDNIDEILAK